MGLKDLIKGQLIDVIEFRTDDKRIIAHRFDDGGKQIMVGAQLTVRPGQMVVFINEGEIADVYKEGRYELTTSNMPILTKLKSWKYGFESPFKVDIYFILMDDKIQQPWGTPSHIMFRDEMLGTATVGANGYYSYRVLQPEVFLKKLVGTDTEFTVEECRPHLNAKIISIFTDFFVQAKVSLVDAAGNLLEFSGQVKEEAAKSFEMYGLQIEDLVIQNLKIPDDINALLAQARAVNVMGGLDNYQRKVMVDSMGQAAVKMAENEGGGGGIGPMGMQMGAGVAMGGMMGQMMQNTMNPNAVAQNQNQAISTIACPKCHAQIAKDLKFCPVCGFNMGTTVSDTVPCVKCSAPIKKDTKFCPECGSKQEVQKYFCVECGSEMAKGTKFCQECGKAQQ